MRVCQKPRDVSVRFDEANLVSCGGLVPVLTLAERCRLAELVDERLTLRAAGGVNAHQAGRRLRVVQEVLGHASLKTTSLYVQLAP